MCDIKLFRYKTILTYIPFLLPVVAVNTLFRQKTIRNAVIVVHVTRKFLIPELDRGME